MTAVENEIPNVNNIVNKADYDTKVSDIENKYITTDDYNKFTKDIVANNIKSKELVGKSNTAGFINNADLDKIIKLQVFDSSFF